MLHTYGTWLRGDPRGWPRHHREHCVGDYNNPPPRGMYEGLYRRSKKLMDRGPVRIPLQMRQFVASAIAESLLKHGNDVVIVSVDSNHVHALARFRDRNARHWIGRAKKNASHCMRQHEIRIEEGGLWGKRSRAVPVKSRAHQVQVFRYILVHAKRGARIWRCDRNAGSFSLRENAHG